METQNPQKTQEPPPEAPADVHILHPITQAAVALHHTLPMLAKNVPHDALSDELASLIAAENITNLHDSTVYLTMHARVLDAIFNRVLAAAMADPEKRPPDLAYLHMALWAQRQCQQTVNSLKKHGPKEKNGKINKQSRQKVLNHGDHGAHGDSSPVNFAVIAVRAVVQILIQGRI